MAARPWRSLGYRKQSKAALDPIASDFSPNTRPSMIDALDMTVPWSDLARTIGLLGAALYLASYAALQFGLINGGGLVYTAANTAAAGMVLVALSVDFNLASTVIQVIWMALGLGRIAACSLPLTLDRPLWPSSRRRAAASHTSL